MTLNEKVSVQVEVNGKDNLSPILDAQKRKAQELASQQSKQRAATGDPNARPPAPPPQVMAPPARETQAEPEARDTRREAPRQAETVRPATATAPPERPTPEPTQPPAPRVPPARTVPVPFQSDAVREARNKARAEAQGLPYQSERVARLRDESRAAAQEKTAKENDKAVDAEKKLADARIRSGKAAVQLIPGLGQIASGFEGLQQTIQDLAGGGQNAGPGRRSPSVGMRAVGVGGTALAGAVSGGIVSNLAAGAVEGRISRGATEVIGGTGGVLGGAAAGALAGSILPGIGTAAGAAIGAVGGLFTSLIGGAERAKKAAQEAEQLWRDFDLGLRARGTRILDAEARRDVFRSGGEATRGDVEAVLSPGSLSVLARARREDRPDVLRRELERARRADMAFGTTETRLAVDTLEAAVTRGVEGITRPADSGIRVGFGEATSVSDAIFESLAARAPAVVAAERTAEETRGVRESIDAMRAEMRETLRALVPGV